MSEDQLEIIESNNSQITEDYESNLKQKMIDNLDKKIIIVSSKDVSDCRDLADVIRVCDNEYYKELLSEGKIYKHLKHNHIKSQKKQI